MTAEDALHQLTHQACEVAAHIAQKGKQKSHGYVYRTQPTKAGQGVALVFFANDQKVAQRVLKELEALLGADDVATGNG